MHHFANEPDFKGAPLLVRNIRQGNISRAWFTLGPRRDSLAFTLVELLVVMAIILILSALIVPAMKGTLEGINLSGTAESISSQLTLARQTAMSRNRNVEVRLYQQSSNKPWNLIALVFPTDSPTSTTDEWINVGSVFPGNVIIDPGQSSVAPESGGATQGKYFSTVLYVDNNQYPKQEANSAPFAVRGRYYVAFRFLPDGSTNLPPIDPASSTPFSWCLTLKTASAAAVSDGTVPAKNFVSLVIDPQTGRVLPYRP